MTVRDDMLDRWSPHQLKEYVEALFTEGQRATEMAEREREKAASALTVERYNAASTAESEREKSAQALRGGLDRAIKEGDERLREHIQNQVAQIQAALLSANALEEERFERAKAEVAALRREMRLIQDAQAEAVGKAEDAQKGVNNRANEFRAQLSDQAASLMPRKEVESLVGEVRTRVDDMLPRETFDTSVSSLESRLTANTSRLDRTSGSSEKEEKHGDDTRAWLIAGVGFFLTLVSLLLVAGDVLTP